MSRRLRLDLAYDGTDFAGWQVQPERTTIQSVLEDALTRLNGDRRVSVRGAGRTDAGVHARAQVCDFNFELESSVDDVAHALHRMLPPSIRPVAVTIAPDGFHARRSARAKHYRYRLDRSLYGNPLHVRYALHQPQPMDLDAMRDALARLPGRRDWSAFTGGACEVDDRVRHMKVADYSERGGSARFDFEGDGFLTHMVRNLVGTLLQVARGARPPGDIDEILVSRDRRLAGPTAPPHGLHLWRVCYDDDEPVTMPDRS